MAATNPITELHPGYSSDDATATPWPDALAQIQRAQIFWLSTVRPDGRPHVTPLIAVWLDGALCFCTGHGERKAKNLAANSHCVVTTGCNTIDEGLDIVIEGEAERVTGEPRLRRIADAYNAKYPAWNFAVRDGAFVGDGGEALVYAITPVTAFGFGKGTFSQTRWRFQQVGPS